jgi:vacuolar-type H+-ATPase subunit I/STV1
MTTENTQPTEATKAVKESKAVTSDFKIIGIYKDDELVSIATSDASRLSKLVALSDKECDEHELVEFEESDVEDITEFYLSQNSKIASLSKKQTRLGTAIDKAEEEIKSIEAGSEKAEKLTEKLNSLEDELNTVNEELEELTLLNEKIEDDEHEDKIYVLYSKEDGKVFTSSKTVKNKKGVERQKLSYFVFGTYKRANYALRSKIDSCFIKTFVPVR